METPLHAAAQKTDEQLRAYLSERSNWGRWGNDDQLGTLNLITNDKRVRAAALVSEGRTASLSQVIRPNRADDPYLTCCDVSTVDRGNGEAFAQDYFGVSYHGHGTTHIDALCHLWQDNRMWNGRNPADVIGSKGASWGDIEQWHGGIVTRGVLLDVPRAREVSYVAADAPVHGAELEAIVNARGIRLEPGDALLVYSGRDAWNKENPAWESLGPKFNAENNGGVRPGLHASCMEFLRENDVAVLMWDMLDLSPSGYSFKWSVHGAIPAFGLALVDNIDFTELIPLARELDRDEFMLTIGPLRVKGGTGSPVNPIAIF